jgi:hypothetical protein
MYQNDSNRAVYRGPRNMGNQEQFRRLRSMANLYDRKKTEYDRNVQQTNRLKKDKGLVDMELRDTEQTLNKLRQQNERLKSKPRPVQSSSSSSSASFVSRPVDNTEQIERLKRTILTLQEQRKTLLGIDENRQAIFSKLKECQDMKRKDFRKDPRMFKIISLIEEILKTGLIDGNIRKKLTTYIQDQITSNESDVGEKLKFYEKYQENEDILRNLYEVSPDEMSVFQRNSDSREELGKIKDLLSFQFTEEVVDRSYTEGKMMIVKKPKTSNLLPYINTFIRKGTKEDDNGNLINVERIISVNEGSGKKATFIGDLRKVDFLTEIKEKGNVFVPSEQKVDIPEETLADCLGKVRDFILSDNAMEYIIDSGGSVKTGFYDLETKANYFLVLNNKNNDKDPTEMSFVKDNYFFNIYLDPEGILKESRIILDLGLDWTQKEISGFNLNNRLKNHIENLEKKLDKKWFKRDSKFFTITEQGATTSSSNTGANEIIIPINEYMDKIIDIVNQDLPTKLDDLQEIVDDTRKTEEEKIQEIFSNLDLSMEGGYRDMNLVNKRFLHLLKCALQGREYTVRDNDYSQLNYSDLIRDCKDSFYDRDYEERVAFCESSKKDFIRRKKESLGMKSDLEFAYMGIKYLKPEIRNPGKIPEPIKKNMTAAELDRERVLFGDLQKFQNQQGQDYGKYNQWKTKQQESQRKGGGRGGFPAGGRGPNPFAGGRNPFAGGGRGPNPFAGGRNPFAGGRNLREVKQQDKGKAGGNPNAVSTSSTSSTTSIPGPISFLDEIKSKRK